VRRVVEGTKLGLNKNICRTKITRNTFTKPPLNYSLAAAEMCEESHTKSPSDFMKFQSELKKNKLLEIKGHVPQCPITGDANSHSDDTAVDNFHGFPLCVRLTTRAVFTLESGLCRRSSADLTVTSV